MIPNQAKKRQPDELVLATFRIPYEKWEKFQQAATAAETTASATLLAFIEDYLAQAQKGIYANIANPPPEAQLESDVEPAESKTATELENSEVTQLNSQLKAEIKKQIEEIVRLESDGFEPTLNAIETQVSELSKRLDLLEHKLGQSSKGKTTSKASEFIDVQAVPIDINLNRDDVESDEQLSQEYDPENLAGLSQSGLCTEFGINPNNLNRHAIRRGLSTAEYLHQLTGWVYRNGKYYPPES